MSILLTMTGKALIRVLAEVRWSLVGNGLAVSISAPGLAALTSSTVALAGTFGSDARLRTYSWNGTDWVQVGNTATIFGGNTVKAIASLNSSEVAFIDGSNEDLRTYSWNGTDWVQVGNDLNIPGVGSPSLAALSTSSVAFIDNLLKELRTYSWNGTDWSQLGNSLPLSSFDGGAITSLSPSLIALVDSATAQLRTYSWDGTNWAQVGNGLNLSSSNVPAITSLSSSRVAFIESVSNQLQTFEWDGTDWSQLGDDLSISVGVPALANISSTETEVALFEDSSFLLRTYRFTGAEPSPPGAIEATYSDSSYSIATQTTSPRSIKFNPSGTKMFVMGFSGEMIYEYSLSTAFDETALSYVRSLDLKATSSVQNVAGCFCFNAAGTRLYLFAGDGNFGAEILAYQFNLSSGYDLSTAVFNTTQIIDEVSGPYCEMALVDSDSRLLLFTTSGSLIQLELANDSITSYTFSGVFGNATEGGSTWSSFAISPNGSKLLALNTGDDTLYEYSLTTPYNPSTLSYTGDSFYVGAQDTSIEGLSFNSDGTGLLASGDQNDNIYKYNLAPNYTLVEDI